MPANTRVIRRRIKSVRNTAQITKAMQMVAAAKMRKAQQMAASDRQFFYADQYNNDFNWRSHYDTTAPEIIRQIGKRMTHYVAGLGTSGTFIGVARRLREFNDEIVLASVQGRSAQHVYDFRPERRCGSQVVYRRCREPGIGASRQ